MSNKDSSTTNAAIGCLTIIVVFLFLVGILTYNIYMKVTCDITEETVLARVEDKHIKHGYRSKNSYKPSKKIVTLTYSDITETESNSKLYNNVEEGDYVEVYLVTYTSKKTGAIKKQILSFNPYVKGDSKLPYKAIP